MANKKNRRGSNLPYRPGILLLMNEGLLTELLRVQQVSDDRRWFSLPFHPVQQAEEAQLVAWRFALLLTDPSNSNNSINNRQQKPQQQQYRFHYNRKNEQKTKE